MADELPGAGTQHIRMADAGWLRSSRPTLSYPLPCSITATATCSLTANEWMPHPRPTLPCPALPCPALPCPALPCPACRLNPALPCPALPCPACRLPCLHADRLLASRELLLCIICRCLHIMLMDSSVRHRLQRYSGSAFCHDGLYLSRRMAPHQRVHWLQ